MYGVDGEKDLSEQLLDHLTGYEGARPVRIGNGAFDQRQHDVWGALLDSVYIHTSSRDGLDERLWPILSRFVEAALEHWHEPDRGHLGGAGRDPKHFTSSKVMCWVAADRGARLARIREAVRARRALAARRPTRSTRTSAPTGVDERGVFAQYYGTTALDASTLLIPLVRLPAAGRRAGARDGRRDRRRSSPRTGWCCATGSRRRTTACRARRARSRSARSGWSPRSHSSASTRRARKLCEKLLSFASPLGLYAEEIDPASGRQLGNFPQAFTHLGLINAMLHVIAVEEDPRDGTA